MRYGQLPMVMPPPASYRSGAAGGPRVPGRSLRAARDAGPLAAARGVAGHGMREG
jgi:hypothetical protein